jgi:hypothetical protein
LGLIATACQWLGARVGEAWSFEDLDLLIPLVFPATGALLRAFALCNMARIPKQSGHRGARVLNKRLTYMDVIPRYIWDFDTHFALCSLPGA